MKRVLYLLLLFLLISNLLYAKRYFVEYKVKSGDTLLGIAKRFNTTVSEIKKLNKLDKDNFIRSNQTLIVPEPKKEQESKESKNKSAISKEPKRKNSNQKSKKSNKVDSKKSNKIVDKKSNKKNNKKGDRGNSKQTSKKNNKKRNKSNSKNSSKKRNKSNSKNSSKKRNKSNSKQSSNKSNSKQSSNKSNSKKSATTSSNSKKRVTAKDTSDYIIKIVKYRVKIGDTIPLIAKEFKTEAKDIREANDLNDTSFIFVGETLKVPKKVKRPPPKERKYTVQSGDTLFSIARKFKTPLSDLVALNKMKSTDIIKPGQVLKIPAKNYKKELIKKTQEIKAKKRKVVFKKVIQKIPAIYHIVKRGDTLWGIADKYNVSAKDIMNLNNLKENDFIQIGQKLLIKKGKTIVKKVAPKKKELKKVAIFYTVKHGDTLWKIAKKYNLTLKELKELNNMSKKSLIHSGMKLKVGYKLEAVEKVAKEEKVKKDTKKEQESVASSKKKSKKREIKKVAKVNKRVSKKRSKKGAKKGSYKNDVLAFLKTGKYSYRGNQDIIQTAKKYLGRKYVWGAEGPNCFDCSGFTQYVLRKSKGARIPRVSREQAYYGKYVKYKDLKPGDLVFFDTSRRRRGYVNHVGIYIGNHKFIHASSAWHRVVITSFITHPFYRYRFKWGRRITK